jgi:2-alkyl-3-oxoalkanoate reductase
MRVFIAGAGGAIGRRLVPKLIERGHDVAATATTPDRAAGLRALGAEPLVMDGLDAGSVGEAVARAEPDVVVHQMTALSKTPDFKRFDETFATTNRLRTEGTDHLLAAAEAVGARRFVAQGFAGWPAAREGGPVKTEDDPLDPRPPAAQVRTLAAFRHLERAVAERSPEGLVLRYGGFYGPGASDAMADLVRARKVPLVGDGAGVWSFVHIDDAAAATVLAVEGGAPGVYNVVDDDPAPVSEWLPHLAACLDARPPRHLPVWFARLAAGEAGVSMMTQIRGASNAKARALLGWEPVWRSWREGFRFALDEPLAA